jgi:hypothetical protein
VIGARIQDLVAPEDADVVSALLAGKNGRKAEMRLRTNGATLVPVYSSVQNVVFDGTECLCLIVTDLSEQKRMKRLSPGEACAFDSRTGG